MLLKSPGFTVLALLSLALGVGANTAIFSMVGAFLFAPLPVERASQLVSIFTMAKKIRLSLFDMGRWFRVWGSGFRV